MQLQRIPLAFSCNLSPAVGTHPRFLPHFQGSAGSLAPDKADTVTIGKNGKPYTKHKLTDEERQQRQHLEAIAPKKRQALPLSLQLLTPLPDPVVKHGHMRNSLEVLQNHPLTAKSPGMQAILSEIADLNDTSPVLPTQNLLAQERALMLQLDLIHRLFKGPNRYSPDKESLFEILSRYQDPALRRVIIDRVATCGFSEQTLLPLADTLPNEGDRAHAIQLLLQRGELLYYSDTFQAARALQSDTFKAKLVLAALQKPKFRQHDDYHKWQRSVSENLPALVDSIRDDAVRQSAIQQVVQLAEVDQVGKSKDAWPPSDIVSFARSINRPRSKKQPEPSLSYTENQKAREAEKANEIKVKPSQREESDADLGEWISDRLLAKEDMPTREQKNWNHCAERHYDAIEAVLEIQDPVIQATLLNKLLQNPEPTISAPAKLYTLAAVMAIPPKSVKTHPLKDHATDVGKAALLNDLFHAENNLFIHTGMDSDKHPIPDPPLLLRQAILSVKNPQLRTSLAQKMATTTSASLNHDGLIAWILDSQEELNRTYPKGTKKDASLMPWLQAATPQLKSLGLDSPLEAGVILQTLQRMDMDGGTLVQQIIPGYYNDFIGHCMKRVQEYGSGKTEQEIIAKYKDDFLNALCAIALAGTAPLKLKLDSGNGKFSSYVKKAAALCQPECDPFLKPLKKLLDRARHQDPMTVVRLVELSWGIVQLGGPESLTTLLTRLANQTDTGSLDITPVKKLYLSSLLKTATTSEEGIAQALQDNHWNLDYIHTLGSALQDFPEDSAWQLKELLRATAEGRYSEFLMDPGTSHGEANLATQKAFTERRRTPLNYETWMNYQPTREFTMDPVTIDQQWAHYLKKLATDLSGIRSDYSFWGKRTHEIESFDALMKAHGVKFGPQGTFTATDSAPLAKKDWRAFLSKTFEILNSVRSSAYGGYGGGWGTTHTQTLLDHLETRWKELGLIGKAPQTPQPLEIKRWERKPGYDLFQGNYCQCCTAMDGINAKGLLEALLHTFVQIAEVKNKDTGKTIGKALLYWAEDEKWKTPILVINGIEMATEYENNAKIRDELFQWIKDYGKEVAGAEVPLYLGTHFLDVPTDDLQKKDITLKVIGNTFNGSYYLDSLTSGRWSNIQVTHDKTSLYHLAG